MHEHILMGCYFKKTVKIPLPAPHISSTTISHSFTHKDNVEITVMCEMLPDHLLSQYKPAVCLNLDSGL